MDRLEEIKEEIKNNPIEGLCIKDEDWLILEIERLRNIAEEIDDYEPGILNDYGEGDIAWWQDYIRCEIAVCNDHWRQALKDKE